jgi:hypothetical protein
VAVAGLGRSKAAVKRRPWKNPATDEGDDGW